MMRIPFKGSILILMALAIATGARARAESFTGSIYELGSQHQKLLYNMKYDEVQKGPLTISQARFTYPDGREAVTEEATLENGKLTKYVIDQKQVNELGRLDIKDGKAYFNFTRNGKTESDTEDAKENLIVAPTTVPFLRQHWAEILRGNDVDSRFAALDRKETVGFKFFKDGNTHWNGIDAIRVKMKPTSFVIAMIVKPLTFTFDKNGQHLLELVGRTLPKIKVDGKWTDLDADIVYHYNNTIALR